MIVKNEIILGSPFEKINDQDLQELQKYVDGELCQDLLENVDKEFMLRFHGTTQKQLYTIKCAHEKDPSHLFEFASQTCALNILADLINKKYYSQSQSPVKCDQLND